MKTFWTAVSPNKPSYPACYGNLNEDVGWDLLDYNLKREKGLISVQSGKYVNVRTWEYPRDVPSPVNTDYWGHFTNTDYSLKIWGATPTANQNTTSTGSKGECISDTEMQYYEDEISLLMDTEKPSGNKVAMVKVISNFDHYTSHIEPTHLPGLWNYHQVSFSEAIHIP